MFRNAESDYPRVNEPGESALPNEPLETVVRLPVTLARSVNKFELDNQTFISVANNKVKAMTTVQPSLGP